MNAMLIDAGGRLAKTVVPDPVRREGEVLIEVHAAAVNRADLMQCDGNYPPPPGWPEWPGLEVAGIVLEPPDSSRFRPGDRVCALLGGGGYAQYAAVRYDMLMPVPRSCSMEEAAAIPEAFATAYLNLFLEGDIQPGNTLLMHAGASGLASVVIPMAKAFGIRVITSVLNGEIAGKIRRLHADLVIDTSRESCAEILKRQLEAGHPVDVAIDCLGGSGMGSCLPYLAHGGRWIMIAALAGTLTEIDLKNIYVRNIRIIGSTLRSRPPAVKARILAELVEKVWPKVEAGLLKPTIYRTLPITRVEEAHAILQRGENVGKVVLLVK